MLSRERGYICCSSFAICATIGSEKTESRQNGKRGGGWAFICPNQSSKEMFCSCFVLFCFALSDFFAPPKDVYQILFFSWSLALFFPFSCALDECKWPNKYNLLVDLVEGDKEKTVGRRRNLALEEVPMSSVARYQ